MLRGLSTSRARCARTAAAARWAHAPSGGSELGPVDDLHDLPWADADDELVDLPSGAAAPTSAAARSRSAAAAAHRDALSLERLAALVTPESQTGARGVRVNAARARRHADALDAIESASLSELSDLVSAVSEESGMPNEQSAPTREAKHALFDPRVRTPPWAQVNLKTSTAVFLLKPPQRVESAQPLAIHGCEPFAERRDFDTQLLAKLIRRHK
ncbi:hypothetical protein KFE25_003692 [Diacronema lutheri]|uniref:Uncharacterized protein n=1 Tax=Diacronema lutheri TaxID=2081491 RepID=A0A8J6CB56_DIALT|nr:hypothetical protein KFE25_003692 [Diacronema lutheri]